MFAEVLKTIRRKPNRFNTKSVAASSATEPIRLSGTVPFNPVEYDPKPHDASLDNDQPYGRTGNDWTYPDSPRGRFDVNTVSGDRLQDQTGRLLHVGEAPGRIPRGWNSRVTGKVGSGITGTESGEVTPSITVTGESGGGLGEMMYIPHTPTPRGVGIARAYHRTIDDAAFIPGVYVTNPAR